MKTTSRIVARAKVKVRPRKVRSMRISRAVGGREMPEVVCGNMLSLSCGRDVTRCVGRSAGRGEEFADSSEHLLLDLLGQLHVIEGVTDLLPLRQAPAEHGSHGPG